MKRIGIIRGGIGEDYEESLKKGADIFSFIEKHIGKNWKPIDIFIDKVGIWHIGGLPVMPADLYHRVDIVWNNASPEINAMLDSLGVPHISTPAYAQGLGKSRAMLENHMNQLGVNMPKHFVIPAYLEGLDQSIEKYATSNSKSVFEKFGSPWIVKSLGEKNPMGIHVAKTYPELVNAIIDGAEHGGSMIVEELISGKEMSVHSLKNFRNEDVYIFPSNVSHEERKGLHKIILDLHQSTDSHYLKSDFILHPRGEIYLKSIAFSLDFAESSHLNDALGDIGAETQHILESILDSHI